MKGVIVLIVVLFATTVIWRGAVSAGDRAAIKAALRKHLWVLALITVLVLTSAYLLWSVSLYGPTIKLL